MTAPKVVLVGADGEAVRVVDPDALGVPNEWVVLAARNGKARRAFQRYGRATEFCQEEGEKVHALVYVERPMALLHEAIEKAESNLSYALRIRASLPACAGRLCEIETPHTMCGKIP